MITRAEVRAVLSAWVAGERDELSVWHWLEAQFAGDDAEAPRRPTCEDELVVDILDILAGMPHDLIVTEDAQVMLDALSNPTNEIDLSQNLLWNHIDLVDAHDRRQALREHAFYGPFIDPDAY